MGLSVKSAAGVVVVVVVIELMKKSCPLLEPELAIMCLWKLVMDVSISEYDGLYGSQVRVSKGKSSRRHLPEVQESWVGAHMLKKSAIEVLKLNC